MVNLRFRARETHDPVDTTRASSERHAWSAAFSYIHIIKKKNTACTSEIRTVSRSRGLELKEILLVQQRVAYTLVVGPAANLRAVGEQVLLDKLAIDAW